MTRRGSLRFLQKICVVLGLAFLVLPFFLPFLWMVGSSLRTNEEMFKYTHPLTIRTFVPLRPTVSNYVHLMGEMRFFRYFLNSMFVALSVTALTLMLSALAAYAFSRMNFPLRNLAFILVLATMMVPFESTVIPLYLVVRGMKMHNTYSGLIVPWIANPFIVFLMRQFFLTIPKDLDEAAIIDGCSHLGVLRHVILPNSKSILVTAGLMSFLWSWDAFLWPLIIIESPAKMVIQVAISSLNTQEVVYWGRVFAACTVASLPTVAAFLALQRYYVQGIAFSGMKQ
ncbi:MAG: carbohydrate ABC transporter permease [Bacillota bacterium]